MKLHGAKVLVTGASSGIGRAIAEALAREGAVLALAGRRSDLLSEVAAGVAARGGVQPVVLLGDLTQPGSPETLAQEAYAALGSIDVVVNNAAVEGEGSYVDTGEAEARALFEVNYWAPLALVRAAVPAMRARGSGAIVNVSSLGAITPVPDTGHYPSTKAALAAASEALRGELRGFGVRMIVVYPGFVDTPMLRAFRSRPNLPARWRWTMRLMPVGRPERLASLVVGALKGSHDTVVYPRSFLLAPHLPSVARRLTRHLFPASDVRGAADHETGRHRRSPFSCCGGSAPAA